MDAPAGATRIRLTLAGKASHWPVIPHLTVKEHHA